MRPAVSGTLGNGGLANYIEPFSASFFSFKNDISISM